MELQPLVGSACAACKKKILVAADAKNCKRCGLAIHRACARDHRPGCAQRPVVAAQATDYGEVRPLRWTTRLVAVMAAGAFVLAMGVGMLANAPSPPAPDGGEAAQAPSSTRAGLAWGAVGVGLAVMAGGYFFERSRQDREGG